MGRYFIELSFDGSEYVGWQAQLNGIGVQQVLDSKLSTIFRENVETVGCGRTDAGVHASYFVAHFNASATDIDLEKTKYQLNKVLPSSIAVFSISPVSPNAHARFDAVERTYRYYLSQHKNPFNSRFAYYFSQHVDEHKMNLAADLLLPMNDFTSFAKLHSDNKTNICKVYKAHWHRENENLLVFTITADRFLRNMVRAIVGTLIDVGRGRISPEQLIEIAEEKNRGAASTSVPAHGLFLEDIRYPSTIFNKTRTNIHPL
ncbi:MAG TPA: tRNA pseudouridine(38-40) synthase TruA [Williamwhitmania sp.]|nr:tRNA pseudouridine(38-40) synthase TruA [Williamwhitmania sp.]